MPDHDWLKAKLEQINERTALTHKLVEERHNALAEKVHANTERSQANASKLHAMEVADAKESSARESLGSYRASAFTKAVVVVTLACTVFGSCIGGLGFLWQLFAG